MEDLPIITRDEVIEFPNVNNFYVEEKGINYNDCFILIEQKETWNLYVYTNGNFGPGMVHSMLELSTPKITDIFNTLCAKGFRYTVREKFPMPNEQKVKENLLDFRKDLKQIEEKLKESLLKYTGSLERKYGEKGLHNHDFLYLLYHNLDFHFSGKEIVTL